MSSSLKTLVFVKASMFKDDFDIRPPGEFLPVGSLQGKLKEKPHFFESLPRLKRNKVVLSLL